MSPSKIHSPSSTCELDGAADTKHACLDDTVPDTTIPSKSRSLPHKTPLQRTPGAATSSDLFRSKASFLQPKGQDFTHLISQEALLRKASTLKTSGSSLTSEIISLSTGRPSPAYFPFESISFSFPPASKFSDPGSRSASPDMTITTVGKHDIATKDAETDLGTSLGYGYSAGAESLVRFLTPHVEQSHNPPYSTWSTILTSGSTMALDQILRILCNRGDTVLAEKHTFSGFTECALPLGLLSIGVEMDSEGLIPSSLAHVMETWDTTHGPRPKMLYMIPTGQNPTGSTQPLHRRTQIYALAEKHNLFIIEDDPYYHLQYTRPLLPSYLALDTAGRVVRLDSMSKILAPGLRCGWLTGPAWLTERVLNLVDVGTVAPSGVSQLMVCQLLDRTWGPDGFEKWLTWLSGEYQGRAEVMVRACEDSLPKGLCKWVRPKAGLFFTVHLQLGALGRGGLVEQEGRVQALLDIEEEIYGRALAAGVMLCKGSTFLADAEDLDEVFFRLTFATASVPLLEEAVRRFGVVLREFASA